MGDRVGGVVRAYGQTDVGLCRAANEDAFTLAELSKGQRWAGGKPCEWHTNDRGVLLIVSDGMGGAKAGEVASALSIEAVVGGMLRAVRDRPINGETLRRVIEEASDKVHEAGKRPDRRGMGATLTAVLLSGMTAYIAQIGDSRAYLLRNGQLGQVTHDQSYVQMLVDAGVMTPEEAEASPRKNIILQVMGQQAVRVVLGRVSLKSGDRLLLCSDGLTNVVDDATIRAVAKPPGDVAKASNALVSLTKEGGAPDNVTVIVAEIVYARSLPAVALPFGHPVEPMLAKLATSIPTGDSWIYEPKWDGFRALIFKDGDQVYIQSRDLKPLERYFPELIEPLRAELPEKCVLDGEIVIATRGVLDFDALLLRIHPAASRVAMLAKESPASFVAWDSLALGDEDLRGKPQEERRERLQKVLGQAKPPIHLTPITRDPKVAQDWFERFEGAGLDGVIAKPRDLAYLPGKRAMMKIKHARTADCVVGGFRWYKDSKGELVGSLLLGLYDDEAVLHFVGVCAAFKREVRAELAKKFEPLRKDALEDHPWAKWQEWAGDDQRKPGAGSRWNRGKDLSWEPLRLELVAEVAYDHLQGTRFRHATHFKRWRPDKPVKECRYDQLEVTAPFELATIFGGT